MTSPSNPAVAATATLKPQDLPSLETARLAVEAAYAKLCAWREKRAGLLDSVAAATEDESAVLLDDEGDPDVLSKRLGQIRDSKDVLAARLSRHEQLGGGVLNTLREALVELLASYDRRLKSLIEVRRSRAQAHLEATLDPGIKAELRRRLYQINTYGVETNGFDELGSAALGVAELERSRPFPKAFPDPLRALYLQDVPPEQALEMITTVVLKSARFLEAQPAAIGRDS